MTYVKCLGTFTPSWSVPCMVNTRLDLHYRQHVEKLLSAPASRKQHSDAFRDTASGTERLVRRFTKLPLTLNWTQQPRPRVAEYKAAPFTPFRARTGYKTWPSRRERLTCGCASDYNMIRCTRKSMLKARWDMAVHLRRAVKES
jgi:hypothetical protein